MQVNIIFFNFLISLIVFQIKYYLKNVYFNYNIMIFNKLKHIVKIYYQFVNNYLSLLLKHIIEHINLKEF